MNAAFGAGSLDGFEFADVDVDSFRPGPETSLVDALSRMRGASLSPDVLDYLTTWPTALQRAVQAVIWENFNRDARVPITFAWTPAYDYSITVYDVVDTDVSHGGITVLFTSRYPADEHPLRKFSGR